ncbi:histone-lysine N-methyltransferase SUVR3 [Telopea speciosissima]|uniref:histone-lysine N-methyltransferase SUVR3 n=1 Tax=Telopea speciosissima TaxID=54955 RepID=UPI001CC7B527|nr:histone-lysine N-methyltransferase SUVR3 [Telopea speciosissima]
MFQEAKWICERARTEDEAELIECAELILPWLPPSDLASVSSTCKALHRISRIINTRRASDAARSFETNPIPFLNSVDDQPYSYFIYSQSQILGFPDSSPLSQQPWGFIPRPTYSNRPYSKPSSDTGFDLNPMRSFSRTLELDCGCDCKICSQSHQVKEVGKSECCPCSTIRPELLGSSPDAEMVMTECGPSCACGLDCEYRSTLRGISIRLAIVKDQRKGWGLHASQFIGRGEFVCEYAGEVLTTEEARRRQQKYDELASISQFSSALLVVREHLPSRKACLRVNIDATRVGNIARFVNHSCDGGNLSTVLVRNSGLLLPRLCFFASRDIQEGEEVTFSYGDVRLRPNGLQCFCSSSGCFRVLPSEQT